MTYLVYSYPGVLLMLIGFVKALTPLAMMHNGNDMMADDMGWLFIVLCILGILIALLLIVLLVLLIIYIIKKIRQS